MKKMFYAASAVAMFAATPAFAQASDQENFDITASVPGTCTIGNPGAFDMSVLNPVTTAGAANTLTLASIGIVSKTQKLWISCNDTNKMTLSSLNDGRLVRQGAAPTEDEEQQGFTNRIGYAVSPVNYIPGAAASVQPSLSNGAPFHQQKTRGAIHQEVDMQVRVRATDGANSTKRPLAGTYKDTVTVTVQISA